MTFISHFCDLLWKTFNGVRGNKPGCFDVVLGPQLQEAIDTDCCSKNPSRNVCWICRRPILRVQPGIMVSQGNASLIYQDVLKG